jgi:hypothetical protein
VEVQAVAVGTWVGKGLIHQIKNICAGETTPGVIMRVIIFALIGVVLWATWHGATHLALLQKAPLPLAAVKAPVISLYSSHLIGHRDRWFSAIGGFKTLVGAVGLILGACSILPCFLPLVIRSIRSIIEATIERKTAAHVMMLWKYKPLSQENTLQP